MSKTIIIKSTVYDISGVAGVATVNGRAGAVTLTQSDVGLSFVDNTADTNKPVSTAQATAISNAQAAAQAASRPVAWVPGWTDITGKPSFFSGAYADLTGKPTLFDGAYTSLTGIPASFTPNAHSHAWADITGSTPLNLFGAGTALQIPRLNSAGTGWEMATISAGGGDMLKSENLAGLTNVATARSNLGLGTAAVSAVGDFATAGHNHTGVYAPASHTHLWAHITDKPTTFVPSAHTHTEADVTGLTAALAGKQVTSAELDAIAALIGTGLLRRNGAGSWALDGNSYQVVDADLTAIAALTGTGYAQRTADNTWALSTPSGAGTQITDAEVLAGTATDARTISAAQAKLAALWSRYIYRLKGITTPPGSSSTPPFLGSATGSSAAIAFLNSYNGARGVLRLTTSTTNASFAIAVAGSGTNAYTTIDAKVGDYVEVRGCIGALGSASVPAMMRLGSSNGGNSIAGYGGALVTYRYDENSGMLICRQGNGGSETTYNTSISITADQWITVRVVCVGSGQYAYYVDGVYQTTLTTNGPTRLNAAGNVFATATGTGTGNVYIDYADLVLAP